MGKAYQAPYDQYTRTLGITDHAIERLRECLDLTSAADSTHRSDDELRNMLDQAAIDALGRDAFETGTDRGQPIQIVKLGQLPVSRQLYALVKSNNLPANSTRNEWVIVTLYDEEMVTHARAAGRWTTAAGAKSPVNHPPKIDRGKAARVDAKFNTVALKLQTALQVAEMKGTPIVPVSRPAVNTNTVEETMPPRNRPAPPPPAPAKPIHTAPTPVASATETCLVTYYQDADCEHYNGRLQTVEFQRVELKQRLGELHGDKNVDKASIRVWREMKATVRVKVEVDIED